MNKSEGVRIELFVGVVLTLISIILYLYLGTQFNINSAIVGFIAGLGIMCLFLLFYNKGHTQSISKSFDYNPNKKKS